VSVTVRVLYHKLMSVSLIIRLGTGIDAGFVSFVDTWYL